MKNIRFFRGILSFWLVLGLFLTGCQQTVEDITYTVTYDANGATSGTVPRAQKAKSGTSIKVAEQGDLEKNGCVFKGWYHVDPAATSEEASYIPHAPASSLTVSTMEKNTNIILYADWETIVTYFTVTYNANGATGGTGPAAQTVAAGTSITIADQGDLTYAGKIFDGWNTKEDGTGTSYAAGDSLTDVNITLYAQWYTDVGMSLEEQLQQLRGKAESDTTYTITVIRDEHIVPYTLSFPDKDNVTVRLISPPNLKAEKIISLTDNGSLFTIEAGCTLILESGITLQGRSSNTASLVKINNDGALVMNAGAKITDNNSTDGGGVYVAANGSFELTGGEVSGNTASSGGGVYVAANGSFELTGGKVSGNTASSGGGVYVAADGSFELTGGEVSGNTAASSGGGVYVVADGSFELTGGKVSGNTASSGGGVYVYDNGSFNMTGGEVSGNTAVNNGGGVYIYFRSFTKTGGTIYGSAAANNNSNRSTSGKGHAVYLLDTDGYRYRNSTAGSEKNMNSGTPGEEGGWE